MGRHILNATAVEKRFTMRSETVWGNACQGPLSGASVSFLSPSWGRYTKQQCPEISTEYLENWPNRFHALLYFALNPEGVTREANKQLFKCPVIWISIQQVQSYQIPHGLTPLKGSVIPEQAVRWASRSLAHKRQLSTDAVYFWVQL